MRSFNSAFNNKDEYNTPSVLVEMIFPYVKWFSDKFFSDKGRQPVVWCPFDRAESKYCTILRKKGFNVVSSHIDDGQDFFKFTPAEFDLIVSNPPFSRKLDIFRRCIYDFDKPFALLMNIMALNYQEIGELFSEVGTDIQFIIPDKKVSFDGKTSSFCSGYVCYKLADRTEFIHLPDNNSGRFYRE